MTAQPRYISGRFLLALCLLALAIGSYAAERVASGSWVSGNHALGLVLLVVYLWMFLRGHRAVVLTSFYAIFYSLGMLVSTAIIATGAHMIEIDHYGTANGAFWVMMIWFVAGMEVTRIGYKVGGRVHLGLAVRRLSLNISGLATLAAVGGTLGLSAYVFAATGGPLLLDVDRVTFWREMAPSGTTILPSVVNQSFFFAAFYYLWQRRSEHNMLLPTLIAVSYVLVALFVLGQKLSIFIIFINAWLLILPGVLPHFRFKMKHVAMMAVIAAALLFYVALTYFLNGRDISFILTRAALQAQLLWSVFEDPAAFKLLPQELNCYFGCGMFDSGIDYISQRYLPEMRYLVYSENENTLSGFMPALSILTFGPLVSFWLHLVVSFVLGFVQRKMVTSFSGGNVIYGFLLFKVHFSLAIMWFAAQEGPLNGLLATLALLLVYRLVFARPNAGGRGDRRPSSVPTT